MRIAKLSRIRGYRVFLDYRWPDDLHKLGRFNVFYGWNGSGKTTLASLLRHVQARTPLPAGVLRIELDDGRVVSGEELATTAGLPSVRVFDRDFVERTVSDLGSGLAHVLYLGEENVAKQAELRRLEARRRDARANDLAAIEHLRGAQKALDDFRIEQARIIKELLSGSRAHANYDKRRFTGAVEGLDASSVPEATRTDRQKSDLHTQRRAEPRPPVERVALPRLPLAALEDRASGLLPRRVVAAFIDELTADTEVAKWVQAGLALHAVERETDRCRFCDQELTRERRARLEGHFNKAYEALQSELRTLKGDLKSAIGALEGVRLPDPGLLYETLRARARQAGADAEAALAASLQRLQELDAAVRRKLANPLDTTAPPAAVAEARAVVGNVERALASVNKVIDEHGRTTDELAERAAAACSELERAAVADAWPRHRELQEAAAAADDAARAARAEVARLGEDIRRLEGELVEHRTPAEELNRELAAYLGRDELRFEILDTGYRLMRGTQSVDHLSDGEKTAIAFLYFLKTLNDRSFDLAEGVVVIDDPVSSLDANAMFAAFAYMKMRTNACGQLLILTHNFAFFRQVKDWFKFENRHSRGSARLFLVRADKETADGGRSASIQRLDSLLERYESEYHYLFARVYREVHSATGARSFESSYDIPNVARRMLETFLAFRYPHKGESPHKQLKDVPFPEARIARILRLLDTFSHARHMGVVEHDPTVLTETPLVLGDLLDFIKAIDREHYDAMVECVIDSGTR